MGCGLTLGLLVVGRMRGQLLGMVSDIKSRRVKQGWSVGVASDDLTCKVSYVCYVRGTSLLYPQSVVCVSCRYVFRWACASL